MKIQLRSPGCWLTSWVRKCWVLIAVSQSGENACFHFNVFVPLVVSTKWFLLWSWLSMANRPSSIFFKLCALNNSHSCTLWGFVTDTDIYWWFTQCQAWCDFLKNDHSDFIFWVQTCRKMGTETQEFIFKKKNIVAFELASNSWAEALSTILQWPLKRRASLPFSPESSWADCSVGLMKQRVLVLHFPQRCFWCVWSHCHGAHPG